MIKTASSLFGFSEPVVDWWNHPLDHLKKIGMDFIGIGCLAYQFRYNLVEFQRSMGVIARAESAEMIGKWDEFAQGSFDHRMDMLARVTATGLEFGATALAGRALSGAEILGEGGLLSRVGLFGREKTGLGLTSRLSKSQIRDYLSKVHTLPREQLIKDLESLGLKSKGGSKDGRFMEFIDKQSNVRVKVHPSDNVGTDYSHIHIYDKKGNPLSAQLKIVPYYSTDAHIEIRDDLLRSLPTIDRRSL